MIDATERRERFEEVAAEVFEPLQRYLRRQADEADADDALSDTLMTVWRRLDDVPAEAVLPWCYGVARRVLANQRRSSRRRVALVERVALSAPPDDGGDADHAALTEALFGLKDADREVLTLWAWEELEPREIAVVLGATANAVSLRLTRAKKRLKAEIDRQDRRTAGHKRSRDTGSRP